MQYSFFPVFLGGTTGHRKGSQDQALSWAFSFERVTGIEPARTRPSRQIDVKTRLTA